MQLDFIDWSVIGAYLLISLGIGLWFSKKASKSIDSFFLGGRNMPWYLAGISMVATTFAADTPLLVTEIVAKNGISGNWLWWNMLIGGMLTTFFFAKLWRRAEVLTELEFIELRYQGKPAAFLRGFKAVYLGLLLNAIVIGWVNFALMSLLKIFFDIPESQLLWYVGGAMLITTFYASLSGLWGVTVTDTVQFFIAMTGCIVLAVIVVNHDSVGGIAGLKEKLPQQALNFLPTIDSGSKSSAGSVQGLSISIITFFSFIGIQWWASWYPGAEPGGGGYVAQRMMSAKNEKHAVYATLFFQVAHYCLRPWPWIIVALATIVIYPDLAADDKAQGYVYAMKDFLPAGLKGLLLVAFLAAYMSTISTQLNWGASFLVNDLYKRFMRPEKESDSDTAQQTNKHYIIVARLATLFIMGFGLFATSQLNTIESAWKFILGSSAGLGLVLILRWYWWRINAWSEITAIVAPAIGYSIAILWIEPIASESFTDNNGSFIFTALFTLITSLVVTYITSSPIDQHLAHFYKKVKPSGWWKPLEQYTQEKTNSGNLGWLTLCWLTAVVFTYSMLFFIGKIILGTTSEIMSYGLAVLISVSALLFSIRRSGIFK